MKSSQRGCAGVLQGSPRLGSLLIVNDASVRYPEGGKGSAGSKNSLAIAAYEYVFHTSEHFSVKGG